MEAIRHILTPDSRKLNILLPDDLVNEELEVIILRVKDSEKSSETTVYHSQKGKLSRNEAERMLAYVEESRKEWSWTISLEETKTFVAKSKIFAITPEIETETIYIRKAVKIKLADAIIAATAKVNNFTLLTRNVADFDDINWLRIENPFDW